jgi:hypothetical protein
MQPHGRLMVGALWNQRWSFATRGDDARPRVSQMLIQPVVSYVTPAEMTLTVSSEMTANWTAPDGTGTWTILVFAMVSRIHRFGRLPVALQGGGGVYVVSPGGGPSWQRRTGFVVILPKLR